MIVRMLAVAGVANWVVPTVVKRFHRRRFLGRTAQSSDIHLTFDDGPDPEATPRILDALAGASMRATFFPTGLGAERHPELVQRIHREGHRVGSHGHRHLNAWTSTPWATAADLRRGTDSVSRAVGDTDAGPLFLRPPFGKLNAGSLPFLSQRTAWWDVDPRDYECTSGAEVFDRLRTQLHPGAVVLLHDGRLEGRGSPTATAEAVELLADHARSTGLRFTPLPEPS